MSKGKFVVASLAYIIVTFALAIIWHIVLFEQLYLSFGYFGENPSFLLGFSSIAIQGMLLTFGYTYIFKKKTIKTAFQYVAMTGIFFWTSHVIAAMAKNAQAAVPLFFAMETVYLALQFGLYGLALRVIYR
ncbi:MAG: hypothetical protein OXR66_08160 [Candidatus Woesearchaeota archaeon]|nr:hypothetical protein [Candidatus Woesearchaeota archaeon]